MSGTLAGRTVAFVGLERTSGVFAYDVWVPSRPRELGYIDLAAFGDEAPEGLLFIPRGDRSALLIVTSEVSSTVSSYAVRIDPIGNRRP